MYSTLPSYQPFGCQCDPNAVHEWNYPRATKLCDRVFSARTGSGLTMPNPRIKLPAEMTISRPWIEISDVLSIFPTLVWKIQLTPGALITENKKILDALNTLRQSSGDIVSHAAWQSNNNLHVLDEFRELTSYINDIAGTILQFLKIGYEAIEITGCWGNINPTGASHKSHSHPNNFLSGVYYVQTHAGGDTINFHDPRIQAGIIRPPVTELTAENTDQVVTKVSNGSLLIFPAFLQHSVDPNRSREERISISFNLMFSSFTENLSKPLW